MENNEELFVEELDASYTELEDGLVCIRHYLNGSRILKQENYFKEAMWHREDGPAVIHYYSDGTIEMEEWYVDGKRHRLDGPAVVSNRDEDNNNAWYLDDKLIAFNISLKDMVAELGVSVDEYIEMVTNNPTQMLSILRSIHDLSKSLI